MKVIDIRTREAQPSELDEEGLDSQSLKVLLTETEKQVLLKACERYRHSIPSYLQSSQAELRIVERIIERLS
jgi:hypothetical protein